MTNTEIIKHRLSNQQIAAPGFSTPAEIVSWMIAMQAQEFAMAKWAIGLRLPRCKEADIDQAFNEGAILRTHLLRPTWHFVTPMDIRLLLFLTAPRIHALNAFMYRKSGLDTATFKRSNDTIAKALQGGRHLTRVALQAELAKVKIRADGIPLSLLMMRAELDGIICSGARQGKQFTYALLDERAKRSKSFNRQEALAAFTERYFTSRGPATLKDFSTWSGLGLKDARDGASSLPAEFVHEKIYGQDYIFKPPAGNKTLLKKTFLMPDYDEYGMSYKDRSALFNAAKLPANKSDHSAYHHMIVINGVIGGTWKQSVKNDVITIQTTSFNALNKSSERSVDVAVKKYALFFNKKLEHQTSN